MKTKFETQKVKLVGAILFVLKMVGNVIEEGTREHCEPLNICFTLETQQLPRITSLIKREKFAQHIHPSINILQQKFHQSTYKTYRIYDEQKMLYCYE